MASLRAFLRDSQREYAQLGRLPETERDRIEEEIGAAVRSCAANIDTLQQMLAAGAVGAGSPAKQPPSADLMAHRQGQVLILSERLRAATALFDRLRSLRYQQLQQQEAARLRRLPQQQEGGGAPQPLTTGQLHQRLQQGAAAGEQQQAWRPGEKGPGGGGGASGPVQQQIQMENQALQLELLSMNDQASGSSRLGRTVAGQVATATKHWPRAFAGRAWPPCVLHCCRINRTGRADAVGTLLTPSPLHTNRPCRCSMRSGRCGRLPRSIKCSAGPSWRRQAAGGGVLGRLHLEAAATALRAAAAATPCDP